MTRLHDERAQRFVKAIAKASDRYLIEDSILHDHLCSGGLHPSEAFLRLQMMHMRAKKYHAACDKIRQIQASWGVSGIIWQSFDFWGTKVECPDIEEDLSCISGDKKILVQGKNEVVAFLKHWSQIFKIWVRKDNPDEWVQVSWGDFEEQSNRSESWLSLWTTDTICQVIELETGETWERPDVHLDATVCWGIPGEHQILEKYPQSGSTWFQFNNSHPSY